LFNAFGGLVIFDEFSGDWARRLDDSRERGWSYWYAGHATMPGRETFRIDSLRIRRSMIRAARRRPTHERPMPRQVRMISCAGGESRGQRGEELRLYTSKHSSWNFSRTASCNVTLNA
jgi:hypothetical protein